MNYKISIIGLVYVGLTLAIGFSRICGVVSFVIDMIRVNQLKIVVMILPMKRHKLKYRMTKWELTKV